MAAAVSFVVDAARCGRFAASAVARHWHLIRRFHDAGVRNADLNLLQIPGFFEATFIV
jgi:hypothetical protein